MKWLFCSQEAAHEVVFHLCVLGDCTKSSTKEEKKTATDATIAALGEFDFEVWTDGSGNKSVSKGIKVRLQLDNLV